MTLMLFLVLSSIPVVGITQPPGVSEMQLLVVNNGSVVTPTFRLEKVALELLMPQSSENQVVVFEGDVKRDSLGNSWLYLEQRNPPKLFHYHEQFSVNVSEIRTTSLPEVYEIPDDLKVYLKSAENIQSDDHGIQMLAESLTNESRTDFERIAVLAAWVYDSIAYNKSMGQESEDAKWVLENRVGTCDEFSTLFIALARSVGIPARFVAGYHYGNGRWEEHAFAEVYLGRWVPVDPTNLEVGRVDAAHLKFAVSNNNIVGSKIKTYGADAERVEWKSDTNIQVLNYTENRKLDYELSVSSDELFSGDSAVVVLKIMSEEYVFLRASLQPCVSDFPFVELDGIEKDVVLEPGREKIIYWRLKVAEDLMENMLYTCPMVLNSRFLEPGEVVLNVTSSKSGEGEEIDLSAELSDSKVGFGRNETVFLHVGNIPASKPVRVGVVSGDFFREFSVDREENIVVSFRPESLGGQKALVYSSTGSVLTLDYVVEEFDEVFIDHITLPSMIRLGEEGEAEVLIKNNRTTSQDLKLYTILDLGEQIKSLSVGDQYNARIPLKFDDVGMKLIVFRLKGGDIDIETRREIRVYDLPELEIDAVYLPNKEKVVVTLTVTRDSARNIKIKVDNETKYLKELFGEETVEFDMQVVNSLVTVDYEDLAGGSYSIQTLAETKEEGLLEKLFRAIGDFIRALLDSF